MFKFIYRAYLEGHANNAHCLAAAVNTVLCALFALAGRRDTEERLKEFLAVSVTKSFFQPFFYEMFDFGSWLLQVYCVLDKKWTKRQSEIENQFIFS